MAIMLAFTFASGFAGQQKATSGTFVLHKFAKAIGTESYSIEKKGETYLLTSHFLFTDRGTKVPLETRFIAGSADMAPRSYSAKGKASRPSEMDDSLTVSGNNVLRQKER